MNLRDSLTGLRLLDRRQWLAAPIGAIAVAVLIGVPAVLIPNPWFGREIPPTAWSYPVWLVTSALSGLLFATFVTAREASEPPASGPTQGASCWSAVGPLLAWFAVGCPVCNKMVLLAIGYSAAITWFAPIQPILAALSLILTTVALAYRLAGLVACPAAGSKSSIRSTT